MSVPFFIWYGEKVLIMKSNVLKYFAVLGVLTISNSAQSMRSWDYHPKILEEYDLFVQKRVANVCFEKFMECIQDESWDSRNIKGKTDSVRFTASPRLVFDFLKDAYSSSYDFSKDALPSSQKTVMDLAGADGRVAELALFTGAKVVLVDINKDEIDEADKRIKKDRKLPKPLVANYSSYVADVLKMDEQFPGLHGQFDVIHMSNLMHFFNVEQTEKLLENLKLFLKEEGIVHGEIDSIYADPDKVAEFSKRRESGDAHPGIFSIGHRIHNYYSIESLQELFEKSGFSISKLYYTSGSTVPTQKKEKSVKVNFSIKKK